MASAVFFFAGDTGAQSIEREPNNSTGTVTALTSGITLQGGFLSSSDVDFYRLALIRESEVTISLTTSTRGSSITSFNMEIRVTVLDENNTPVGAFTSEVSGEINTKVVAGPGAILIKVENSDRDFEGSLKYFLTATATATSGPSPPDGGPGPEFTNDLPSGIEGPAGLDLDISNGNQHQHQIAASPGDEIPLDVFLDSGAFRQTGYQMTLSWDPTQLELISYQPSGVFEGGLNLPSPGVGTYSASVALFGGASSSDAGSIGIAVFRVLATFTGPTSVHLTELTIGTSATQVEIAVGTGAAWVIIGGSESPTTADFDGDGKVGFSDFLVFAEGFGTALGDALYDRQLDLDNDDAVGFSDFLIFANAFEQ